MLDRPILAEPVEKFARKFLFEPLEIRQVIWPVDPQGNNNGGFDLKILSPDLQLPLRCEYRQSTSGGTYDVNEPGPSGQSHEITSTSTVLDTCPPPGYPPLHNRR